MQTKNSLLFLSLSLFFSQFYSQELGSNAVISASIAKSGEAFIKDKKINSVSIGVYKDGQVYTQHFGELEKGKGNAPNNKTIYEVASVTKTMTGYLAAQAVLDNKIRLEDDVRMYLTGDYANLEFNNTPIQIKHLLEHTSGLPKFLPMNMNGVFEALNPEVPTVFDQLERQYSKQQFLNDLKTVTISAEPGTTYVYSNAGAELMGYILETVYNKNIDALLQESFLAEYNMQDTAIHLDPAKVSRLAQGYWMNNTSLSPNQANLLWATGSGAKATLPDLLRYAALQLDTSNAVAAESQKLLYQEGKFLKVAYYWRIWEDKYGRQYNHHGGTSGMQNWLFIFPKYNLGISILTNQSGPKTPNKLSKTVKKILKDIVDE